MAQPQSGGFLTLLRNKDFLRLWLAQLLSLTVFNASTFSLISLTASITGATTPTAIVIICYSLPGIIFGPPAGVVVDHMNRRRVLWGSNALRAVVTVLFIITLFFDRNSVLLPIYLLTFVISTIAQFFTPAEGSTIPLLVKEEELMPALSLFSVTLMIGQAIGYVVVGGLMLNFLRTFSIFGLTFDPYIQLNIFIAFVYVVCALLIIWIPRSKFGTNAKQKEEVAGLTQETIGLMGTMWRDTVQGWQFVRKQKGLFLAVMQLSFAGVLLLVIAEEAARIVKDLLGMPESAMVLVFVPAGIGLVGSSLLMPIITRKLGRMRTINLGIFGMALAAVLLPFSAYLMHTLFPTTWQDNPLLFFLIAIVMIIAGASLNCINVPANTSLQNFSPRWIKGRVIALQLTFYNLIAIPVLFVVGIGTDKLGLSTVFYIASVCFAIFGIWSIVYGRKYQIQEISDSETAERELDAVAP
jgi:MFS family permease